MFSLTLGVLLFVLWTVVNRLQRQVLLLQDRLALVERLQEAVDRLTGRVAILERARPVAAAPVVAFSGLAKLYGGRLCEVRGLGRFWREVKAPHGTPQPRTSHNRGAERSNNRARGARFVFEERISLYPPL